MIIQRFRLTLYSEVKSFQALCLILAHSSRADRQTPEGSYNVIWRYDVPFVWPH